MRAIVPIIVCKAGNLQTVFETHDTRKRRGQLAIAYACERWPLIRALPAAE
jgi:hypothetical protein